METIIDKIRSLPPQLQQEVEDFVDFLLAKIGRQEGKRFLKLDWAGGLARFRSQYTALELQQKA
ncbi:MAG: DUF2281 domain-containing protein, partial [Armatimonadota bacterium]|nr:DUF2281 domain-containing protein [Armatimonadota bacterium]